MIARSRTCLVHLAAMAFLLLPAVSFAEESAPGMTDYSWVLIKMLFVLGFVCALAFLLLRFLLPRYGQFGKGSSLLVSVIGRYPLEPRKTLYVIRVSGNYHLIGASEQGISYLVPVPKEEVTAWMEESSLAGGARPVKSFQELLQNLRGGKS